MSVAEPISLYIDLEPQQTVNLDVAARAALAWSEAIREIAYIIDPTLDISVELESGTEGSLSLNSILRIIRGSNDKQQRRQDLRTVKIAVLLWLLAEGGSYAFGEVMDWLRGEADSPVVQELTEEQLNQIADRISQRLGSNVARPQRQQIYRELERDTAVRGVGVSLQRGKRPTIVVPRSEFARRSESVIEADQAHARKRITNRRLKVTLISPTLKGVPRSWRFQVEGLPEFGALMRDAAFLQAIEDGRVMMSLRTGVEMEIDLETKEDFEGGVWVVKERSVTAVQHPPIDRSTELALGSPGDK